MGRMLRLTSLAPDIVEAIVRGKEPDGISLRQLHDGLPLLPPAQWHPVMQLS